MKFKLFIKRTALFLLIIAFSISVVACAGQQTTTPAATTGTTASSTTTQGTEGVNDGPLGKYDPAITVTIAQYTVNEDYAPGESEDDNRWIRAYFDTLGIKIEYAWTAPKDQYDNKLSLSLATKDLPDLFYMSRQNFAACIQGDVLADQQPALENYTSDLSRELLDGYELSFESGRADGKLLGYPQFQEDPTANMQYTWVRKDWLKAVGIEEIKTQEDLINAMIAFTKQDPNATGKNDTYGFAMFKDLWSTSLSSEGFFNSYHAYPNIWIEKDGKLEYGSVQPEIKNALADLQKLYAAGVIDPEFGVKDLKKVEEDIVAGKIGIVNARWWYAAVGSVGNSHVADANADWAVISPVSVDDQPAYLQSNSLTPSYYIGINKDFEHPEVYVKMVNLFLGNLFGPESNYNYYGIDSENGTNPKSYAFGAPWPYWNTRYDQLLKIWNGEWTREDLREDVKVYYDNIMKYKEGDNSSVKYWGNWILYGEAPDTSYAIRYQIRDDERSMNDLFYGFDTKTMQEKKSTLKKLQDEVFINIILGAPLDEFDAFVNSWHQLGGEQITAEVNDWYKNK